MLLNLLKDQDPGMRKELIINLLEIMEEEYKMHSYLVSYLYDL